MVVIIDYGASNTKSVRDALDCLGYKSVVSSEKNVIQKAKYVILPGVGHAHSAMRALEKHGLIDVIKGLDQPVLGVCLGMQLLCKFSYEGSTPCLGIIDAEVVPFRVGQGYKVPHMGWNYVGPYTVGAQDNLAYEGYFYFVHSYYVPIGQYTLSTCSHHIDFSATVRYKNFFGVQFHPEKSSNGGLALLSHFCSL